MLVQMVRNDLVGNEVNSKHEGRHPIERKSADPRWSQESLGGLSRLGSVDLGLRRLQRSMCLNKSRVEKGRMQKWKKESPRECGLLACMQDAQRLFVARCVREAGCYSADKVLAATVDNAFIWGGCSLVQTT